MLRFTLVLSAALFGLVKPVCAAPRAPSGLVATSVTETTATLRWEDNSQREDGFNISRLDEGEDPNVFAHWDRIATVGRDVTRVTIRDLPSGRSIWVRIRAFNENGFSPFSNIVELQTLPASPCPAPQRLRVTDIAPRSAIVRWDDSCGNESGVNVSRLDEGEDPTIFANWDRATTAEPNTTAVRLRNLEPGKKYSVRARYVNPFGFSEFSSVVEFQTTKPVCPAPTDLRATDIDPRSALLRWSDTCGNETRVNIARLDEGEDPNTFAHWDKVAAVDPNVQGVRVRDLRPGRTYVFRVRYENEFGFSEFSNHVTVATPPASGCLPPSNVQADLEEHGVTLSWQDTCDRETSIVVLKTDNPDEFEAPDRWEQHRILAPNTTSALLDGLQSGSWSAYCLRYVTDLGRSEFSERVQVDLPDSPRQTVFVRGDANADGVVQITDAVAILEHLFVEGSATPPCRDSANANGLGSIDLTDGVFVLLHLFSGGPPPPAPYPACGTPSETIESLGCISYAACPQDLPSHCDDAPVEVLEIPSLSQETVGSIPTRVSVGATGSAACTIPIAVPPGTAGMEPRLSFAYSSRSGNGLLGMGWALSGFPSITRCAASQELDGFEDPVDFRLDDRFCLDGQRLIAVSGEYGHDGTEYRTQTESFSRVVSHGVAGEGPSSFTVYSKDGKILEFGSTENSRIEASGRVEVAVWAISRIRDRNGNYIEFSYIENAQSGDYYPDRVSYTGNQEQSLLPYACVTFGYEERPDFNLSYHAGSRRRLRVRLKSIQTWIDDALVYSYVLGYEQGSATGRTRLSQVTLVGADGTHFPPTRFSWRDNERIGTFSIRPRFSPRGYDLGANGYRYIPGDVDGDGRADLIHLASARGVRVFTSNGDGSFEVGPVFPDSGYNVASNGYKFISGDFNGDGRTDLLHFVNHEYAHVWHARRNRASFSIRPRFPARGSGYDLSANDYRFKTGDFDGDGRTDLVHLIGPNRVRFWISRGDGTFEISPAQSTRYDISSNDYNVRVVDFDGDGKSDILHFANKNFVRLWRSTGSRFRYLDRFPSGSAYDVAANQYAFTTGDFNGDGKTDLIHFADKSHIRVWLSRGDGTFDIRRRDSERGYDLSENNYHFQLGDFNGDRKTDLIHFANENAVRVWISIGNGKFRVEDPFPQTGYRVDSNRYRFLTGNFGSDSKQDLLHLVSDSYLHVWNASGPLPDLMTGVVDGLGKSFRLTYRPLTNDAAYTKESGAVYPETDLQGPLYVVTELAGSDGVGGEAKTTYTYGGAKAHRDHGFLGFRWQRAIDQTTQTTQYTEFRQDYPYVGTVAKSETVLSNGTVVARSTNTWSNKSWHDQRVRLPYLSKSVVETFELDGSSISTVTTSNDIDEFGNPVRVVVSTDDGHVQVTESEYSNDTGSWTLGNILRSSVTAAAPGTETLRKTSSFSYSESTGLIESETIEPGTSLELATSYSRDAFGNVVEASVVGGKETRNEWAQYDARGRFLVQQTNALGHTESTVFDPRFGAMVETHDANSLVTWWEYDSLGRRTKERRPDGTATVWRYLSPETGAPSLAASKVEALADGAPPQTVYFDVLRREIRTRTVSLDGAVVFQDVDYDSRGRTERTSRPYFAGDRIYWTNHQYDVLGRNVRVVHPDGSKDETIYQGLSTTSINGLGQRLTTTTNSQGWTTSSTDHEGNIVEHQYDAFGRLTTVRDPAGNEIVTTYDARGQRLSVDDPDAGLLQFRHNAFGELEWQRDAKGQVVSMERDSLGRVLSRSTPEGDTNYEYDLQAGGIGSLARIYHSSGYERIYTYDSLARPRSASTIIEGTEYVFYYGYDQFGRPDTVEYPTGFTTKSVYSDSGYLLEVRSGVATIPLWSAKELTAAGQVRRAELGNGLETNLTFDPATGWLTNLHTGTSRSTVQSNSYAYDSVGSVVRRSNSVTGLHEDFRYDSLNRLVYAESNHGNLTLSYDALGNIRFKSPIGSYRYDGEQPHAVTEVTGIEGKFEYDANGNLISGAGRSISYTSFNKPTRIERGDEKSTFAYAPDQSILRHVSEKDGERKETLYVDPLFEVVAEEGKTTNRHMVQVAGRTLAVYSTVEQPSGASELRYLHHDHLGSVEAVTDKHGTVVERFSYDVHGLPRDPNGTPLDEIHDRKTTDRGFGAHLQLEGLDLVHMGGRLYDPVLGRFTTPDPFVQSLVSLQAFNRYSYVLNNPLSLTDPSGYWSFGDSLMTLGMRYQMSLKTLWMSW